MTLMTFIIKYVRYIFLGLAAIGILAAILGYSEKKWSKKTSCIITIISILCGVLTALFPSAIEILPPTTSQPVVASSSEIDTSTTTAPSETSTNSNTVEPPETSTTTLPSEFGNIQISGKHISGYFRKKDNIQLRVAYTASTTGDHRFEFSIPHVSNQYRVVLLDDTGREVESTRSSSSGMTVYLKENKTYQVCVTVSQFSEPFSFDIMIREPDN